MSFFVTSVGTGKGANLGGLAGADAHCQTLAAAVGAGGKDLARLPQHAPARRGGERARPHRQRARGRTPRAWSSPPTSPSCTATQQPHQADRADREGRGRSTAAATRPTARHPDRLAAGRPRAGRRRRTRTCGNWTKSGEGSAIVGHHDRMGLRDDEPSKSWNSSHPSRGCSQDALQGHRRRRPVLLLRDELVGPRPRCTAAGAVVSTRCSTGSASGPCSTRSSARPR